MTVTEILKELCNVDQTQRKNKIIELLPKDIKINITPLGTIQAVFDGKDSQSILLDAHMDTIHFVVTDIIENGFLKVAPCGGADCRVLAGAEVTVCGKELLYGVFTIMPPHLKRSSDSNAVVVEDMAVDLGYSLEQVRELVAVGDVVTFKPQSLLLLNNRLVSSGIDNLAGVATLIVLAYQLKLEPMEKTVVLQFSVLEETGHRYSGGVTGAFTVQPQEALVVDASFAKYPGLRYATPGELGNGVMIGHSPMLSSVLSCGLKTLANEKDLPYTCEVMGGASGTNADGIVGVGNGIPTALVSYPIKNMHTGVEMVDSEDLQSLLSLLFAYCKKGGLLHE